MTFVDSTTLTATVPWGMNPGSYALTVINPDGGSASLPAAFTVTQGIGRWNGAALYGGDVRQILMKPGDPSTLYAPAYGLVGLFRSTDAGATWQYMGGGLSLGNRSPSTPSTRLALGVCLRRRGCAPRTKAIPGRTCGDLAGRTPDRPRSGLSLALRLSGRLRQLATTNRSRAAPPATRRGSSDRTTAERTGRSWRTWRAPAS